VTINRKDFYREGIRVKIVRPISRGENLGDEKQAISMRNSRQVAGKAVQLAV